VVETAAGHCIGRGGQLFASRGVIGILFMLHAVSIIMSIIKETMFLLLAAPCPAPMSTVMKWSLTLNP